ncbi:ABC transporter permease [Botryobacter ruber]|uniref:ABC transporter permease n=1 Tax=Botryobacter ruber TaxID=2171629 RepID=UPI000E0C1F1D|nr:ABC transporter permease [Botryobacter ruber]
MKQLLNDIMFLWSAKPIFRVAGLYLVLFLLLVLLLPWLPLPYNPTALHLDQVYQPPFKISLNEPSKPAHWFGTDALGRDVLAYTLYGARTAAFISLPVMLLTTAIGLVLGTCAGYFANTGLKTSRGRLLLFVLCAGIFLYLGLYIPLQVVSLNLNQRIIFESLGMMLLAVSLLWLVGLRVVEQVPLLRSGVAIPLDRLVLWLIETFTSIPKLVFILVLASFMPPSVVLLSAVLVVTYWTGTARLARAEILKIKQLPYIEAASSLGVPTVRLLFYHAVPNLVSPVLVTFIFGLAGLLAFESTLSFLGIGVPADLVSWGRMMAGIRNNTAAWWLVVFPGAFLVLTVLALQVCSYYYLELLKKRKN